MLKVLLVEDENLIRRGLAFQMNWTDVGCVLVGEAASGEEGLEQIEALHPDIVITDIRMQDMDGLDMIRRGQEICSFRSIMNLTTHRKPSAWGCWSTCSSRWI